MLNYYEYADLIRIKHDKEKQEQQGISQKQLSSGGQRQSNGKNAIQVLTPIPESRHEVRQARRSSINRQSNLSVQRYSSVDEHSALCVASNQGQCHTKNHGSTSEIDTTSNYSGTVEVEPSDDRDSSQNHERPATAMSNKQRSEAVFGHKRIALGSRETTRSRERPSSVVTQGERCQSSGSQRSQRAESEEPVVTIPIPTDSEPVMLEVCINVLNPYKKVIPNIEGRSSDMVDHHPAQTEGLNGNIQERQVKRPSKSLVPPPTGSSSDDKTTSVPRSVHKCKACCSRGQDTPISNTRDNCDSGSKSEEVFITNGCKTIENNVVTANALKKRSKNIANHLYQIPRPCAPTPSRQELLSKDSEVGHSSQTMVTSPKYTEYSMEFQDRNTFRSQNQSNQSTTHGMVTGHYRAPSVSEKATPQKLRSNVQDPADNEKQELVDEMIHNKKIVINPGNYRSSTALRIRIPMESDRLKASSVKLSQSMEDVRNPKTQQEPDSNDKQPNALFHTGSLQRYASDPMVSSRKVSEDYIDTYQLEMEVMRKQGTSNQLRRPRTAVVHDPKFEAAQVEAERRRKHRLLHSAIKGWGSTTTVLRPKSDQKQTKYSTPLMIKALPRPSNCQQRQVGEVHQQNDTVSNQEELANDMPNQNSEKAQVCQVKIRLQRKTRPKTSVAREAGTDRNNAVLVRPRTASSAALSSGAIKINESMTIQPVPGSAIARTFQQMRYNRPKTSGSQRETSPVQGMKVLDRLVILGNRMTAEMAQDEYLRQTLSSCGTPSHSNYTRHHGYSK